MRTGFAGRELQPLSQGVITCSPARAQPPHTPAPDLGSPHLVQPGRKSFLCRCLAPGQPGSPPGQSSQVRYWTVLGLTTETKCQEWIIKHKIILFGLFYKPT